MRGWLTALDTNSGKIAWRPYSTRPDAEVRIGPNFKPFYPQDRGKDLRVTTWPPDAWKIGDGTVWGWISYDPKLNLIYYGTGNRGPWNPDQRPGDNKCAAGMFARNPDDGQAAWAYQWTPHDRHDYDGSNELILLDLPINGQTRKVLVRPKHNGYIYALDRASGEVLSAKPFVCITSSTSIGLKTGRPTGMEGKKAEIAKVVQEICPAPSGAKDWQRSAFSPQT